MLIGCILHIEEHNLLLFINALVIGCVAHSKYVGIFSVNVLDSCSLLYTNYICYFVKFLSMIVILLYLSSQVFEISTLELRMHRAKASLGRLPG